MKHFLVIHGPPPVKKNQMQIVTPGGSGNRPIIIPSKAYKAWIKGAVMELRAQWNGDPIPDKTEIHATFTFFLAARQRPDLSNLYEAPQDALEDAGIIKNDFWITSHDGSRRLRDRGNPRVEIELEYGE